MTKLLDKNIFLYFFKMSLDENGQLCNHLFFLNVFLCRIEYLESGIIAFISYLSARKSYCNEM